MNNNPGDLYGSLGLDPAEDTDILRTRISGRDAQLDDQGLPPDHPQRRQLQTAFAVLGDDDRRLQYDRAILDRRPLSWPEIEHLGNFGTLPQPHHPQTAPQPDRQLDSPLPFASPQQTRQPYPTPGMPSGFATFPGAAPVAFGSGPYDLDPRVQDRPSAGIRLLMAVVDTFIAGAAAGMIGLAFFWWDALASLVMFLVFLAYFIGFEFKTGATPAKHMFGYQVRDVATGQRPSIVQSAKRQWWRLINFVPGIGQVISLIGAIVVGVSINRNNSYLGSHDRWAGTEVIRKG